VADQSKPVFFKEGGLQKLIARCGVIEVIHKIGIGESEGSLNPLSEPLKERLGLIHN